jgi:DNA adenine methylase
MHYILNKFPQTMNNYHEIFLGGGSVLLAVLNLQKQQKITIRNKIYAYDINETLIAVYKHIQTNKDELCQRIDSNTETYNNIQQNGETNTSPKTIDEAMHSKENYYYWLRSKYNQITTNTIEQSALFILLNKMCFRGLYREGTNGYNVPYGHYKKTPTIIIKSEINKISNLIQNVEFVHSNFKQSLKKVRRGDFMYLDPPYAPTNKQSFAGYTYDGFGLKHHKTLFARVKKINRNKNVPFVMSNSKVDLVEEEFADFPRENIMVRRAINSTNPGSTATEVIIYTKF